MSPPSFIEGEPTAKAVEEDNNIVILLPIREGDVLLCPLCQIRRIGRYTGARKVENLVRHIKEHHPESITIYRCWKCLYVAPAGAKYPRKVVTGHCTGCVPELMAVPSGAGDATRRQNIRRRIGATTSPPSTPVRRSTRQSTSQRVAPPAPVRVVTPPQQIQEEPTPDSSEEEVFLSPTTSPVDATHSVEEVASPPSVSTPPSANNIEPREVPCSGELRPSVGDQPTPSRPASREPSTSPTPQPPTTPVASPPTMASAPSGAATSPPEAEGRPVVQTDQAAGRLPRPQTSRRPYNTERQRLVARLEAVGNAEQLELIAPAVAQYLGRTAGDRPARQQQHARTRPRRAIRDETRARPSDRIREASRFQRLFRTNRKRAVQEILAGPNRSCQIPLANLKRHFDALAAPRDAGEDWPDVFDQEEPTAESNEALCGPCTREEVMERLKGRTNTAPGPDGITYSDLRKADPGAHVLSALFNVILRTEAVPSSWKTSHTILLYKKGDTADVSNWRPISLGDTVPKLFAAVLAERVKKWAMANKRFSDSQKGFLEFEGCFEHNYVLQEVLRDARRNKREVVVAWLDFSSAFTSVPHSSLFRALEGHGMPRQTVNILRAMYDGMTTRIKTDEGISDPILMHSGVRQGCPMSPNAFNLGLEVVLRAAAQTGLGYSIGDRTVSNLAYADDVAILANSEEEMRILLEAVQRGADAIGLAFNPAKCATLHISAGGDRVCDTHFIVQGQPVRALGPGESYNHLGIPTGFQVRQTPVATIADLLTDIRAIDRSPLAPWQKLDAVGTFLLPRLDFILQGAEVEKEHLSEADKIIKKLAKSWMSLPQRASAETVFLPPSRGGGGLLPLADLGDLLTAAHAFKMLSSKDPAVRGLAESSLSQATSERLRKRASNIDMARYLSGDLDLPRSSVRSNYWSKVRSATARLKDKIRLRWLWSPQESQFWIQCGQPNSAGYAVLEPCDGRRVTSLLRRCLNQYYEGTLLAKPDQGKVFEVTRRNAVSNHFLRTGRFTRFCDWRFIHRARLDVLPLNATKRWLARNDKRCRKCGGDLETLPHVLNHCGVHGTARTRRHDNIQNRLVRAIKCPGTVRVNRTVEGAHDEQAALRPDIVVRDDVGRRITIVDVAIPFENRMESFHLARQRKLAKYQPLADQMAGLGYETVVESFIVGALGGWDKRNERVMNLLGISRYYSWMMRRFMISDTVRWSRDIYLEHVSGIRQYAEDGDG